MYTLIYNLDFPLIEVLKMVFFLVPPPALSTEPAGLLLLTPSSTSFKPAPFWTHLLLPRFMVRLARAPHYCSSRRARSAETLTC